VLCYSRNECYVTINSFSKNNIQYQKSYSRKKIYHLQYIFRGKNRNPRLIIWQDPNLWAAIEFAYFFFIISPKSDHNGTKPNGQKVQAQMAISYIHVYILCIICKYTQHSATICICKSLKRFFWASHTIKNWVYFLWPKNAPLTITYNFIRVL